MITSNSVLKSHPLLPLTYHLQLLTPDFCILLRIPHSAFDMSPEFSLPLFTFPKEWTIEETIKGHGSVSLAFLLRR